MPLDKEFYYRDFVRAIAIKLNDYIKQLHLAYQKRNDNIVDIKDNLKYYNAVNFDVSPVYEINPTTRLNTTSKAYNKLSIRLKSYVASYNYLVYEKIPLLKRKIETYAAMNNCSAEFYSSFRQLVCHKIAQQLLRGNAYSFGEKLGYLQVHIHQFDITHSKMIDVGESYDLRNKLIKAGFEVESKENPNGRKWKVKFKYDWVARARFRIYHKSIHRSKFYKFRWGWTPDIGYNNTPEYHQNDTFDQILNNRSMNFLDKLFTICFNFPSLKWEMYNNNKPKENTKNYDEQSIICE